MKHTLNLPYFFFINIMSSYSYCKLISMPTRVIKNSVTLIDNVYCNLPNIYDTGHSGVLYSIRTSDHMPISTVRIQRRKPTRGGSVWTQVQQIFFNTSSTTDVLTTCGFSGFRSI